MMTASSLQIPEGTETVLPQFSSAQLDLIRSELYRINDRFGLWDGIAACLPEGAVFSGYSDEQVMWEYQIIWGTPSKAIWVAARGFSKTWTSIDAYVKKMLLQRTWVVWIPGGSIEQTEQARAYFQAYFDSNLVLYANVHGNKWTETYKTFRNGSFIKFTSATVRGVQSKRATDVHCDEGQLLTPQVYQLAKRQATKKGAHFALTGTALADTLFQQTFLDVSTPFRMMTPVHLAVYAGIIDEQKVIDDMNDPQILLADNLEQLWCIWQKKSDRAFAPVIVDVLPPKSMMMMDTASWGWDFNKAKGHWGVKSVRLTDGRILSYKEECTHSYNEILDISDADIYPEDGGSNDGYCDALVHENLAHYPKRRICRDIWTSKTKPKQVAEVIRLQEHGQWVIYRPGCPVLASNAPRTPFDIHGMPMKEKMEELGMNPHVIDADIHSLNGCTRPPSEFNVPANYRRGVPA